MTSAQRVAFGRESVSLDTVSSFVESSLQKLTYVVKLVCEAVCTFFYTVQVAIGDFVTYCKERLQRMAVSLIIPSQSIPYGTNEVIRYIGLHDIRPGIQATEVTLPINDRVTLDGIELTTQNQEIAASDQRWIVYFLPNAATVEMALPVLQELHQTTAANILSCNYPGVGRSTGEVLTEDDLTSYSIEVVRSLLQKGVKPEHIFIHGFSLGGAVATHVTKQLEEEGIQIAGHCNERSMSSLIDLLNAKVWLIGYLAGLILSALGWKLNSGEKVQTIQSKVLVMTHPKDQVMSKKSQLRNTIAAHPRDNFVDIEMSAEESYVTPHGRSWFPEERRQYGALVKELLRDH